VTHRVLGYREWSDPEPDTIRVGVEVSAEDGRAFVTFTMGSSTWLTSEQAHEISNWVRVCGNVATSFNDGGEKRYVTVPAHDRQHWLGDGDWVLRCGCTVGCTFTSDHGQRVDLVKPGPHLREPV
jgi:hypothetical protein